MSLSESMSALCEEIERSQNERSHSIMQTRRDVMQALGDSQKMMSNIHSERMKATEEMRIFLDSENMKMARETSDLLMRFKRERNEMRDEFLKARGQLLQAFDIWRRFYTGRQRTKPFARAIPPTEKGEEAALPKGRLGRRKAKK